MHVRFLYDIYLAWRIQSRYVYMRLSPVKWLVVRSRVAPGGEPMEPLGTKLRRQRRRLGLTLDELAGRTGISKPYLSLIETGRVPNPPSDEKLRRLEQSLGFTPRELISQAHLQRTPRDVRAMLQKLMAESPGLKAAGSEKSVAVLPNGERRTPSADLQMAVNLDDAYLSGVLQDLVDKSAGNVESVATNAVPV